MGNTPGKSFGNDVPPGLVGKAMLLVYLNLDTRILILGKLFSEMRGKTV